jgi:hypothetical protein
MRSKFRNLEQSVKPRWERFGKLRIREVSGPGDMAVGPYEFAFRC